MATGGASLLLVGAVIGAAQYGSNSLVDQNYSIYAVDYGKVATESLKGGIVGALEAAGGQVVTNLLPPMNFCGKGAMEAFGDMAEHWAVNTLADGATGMAATFFSNLIDGQSAGEAWDSTLDDADSIWGTAMLSSAYSTIGDAITAPKCFVAGTMVTTATGLVAIENIAIGDYVLSENPETGEIAYQEVLDTFQNETDTVVHVKVNNESFACTAEHPFYVEGKGWVNASALRPGMVVWLSDGTKTIIQDVWIEYLAEAVTVFNIKVDAFHTYFIGYSSVLVHNANCSPNRSTTKNNVPAEDDLPSRNAALNQAKQDADIPRSSQPTSVKHIAMTEPGYAGGHSMKDSSGNVILTREYHYVNQSGEKIIIQEHSAPHIGADGPHFNVRPADDTRHGTVPGTKEHYPFGR